MDIHNIKKKIQSRHYNQRHISIIFMFGLQAFPRIAGSGTYTMEGIDPHMTGQMGQRAALSFYDVQAANQLYKCAGM